MEKGYLKFKKRARLGAWMKALLFGLALGVAVVSGWFLVNKLMGNDPQWLLYGIVGGGVALMALILVLLRIFPTDRRLAQRLDISLGLDEKIQTMVEYRGDETPMVQIQRSDADRILSETPTKRARSKRLWLNVVTPVLAVALMVSAILVPAKAEESVPPPVDPSFKLDEWQEMALKQLIEKVKTSTMDVVPKGQVVGELESLLTEVKAANKASVMKQAVVSSIVEIHTVVTNYNTYGQMGAAMGTSDSDIVKDWGAQVAVANASKLSKALDAARQTLVGTEIKPALLALTAGLTQALEGSSLDNADPLYRHTVTFADTLNSIAEMTETMETTALTEALDLAFKTADGDLSGAIQQQRFNETVRDETIATLISIFKLTWDDLPEEVRPSDQQTGDGETDNNSGDDNDDDDEQQASGGIGNAEVLYGSDDTIYDADRQTYVKYGEVLNEYYAKISERVVDGNLDAELEELISDYFASLYDGSENKKS